MHLEGASKRGNATRVIVSRATADRLGGAFPLQPLAGEIPDLFEIQRPWGAKNPDSPAPPREGNP